VAGIDITRWVRSTAIAFYGVSLMGVTLLACPCPTETMAPVGGHDCCDQKIVRSVSADCCLRSSAVAQPPAVQEVAGTVPAPVVRVAEAVAPRFAIACRAVGPPCAAPSPPSILRI